MFSVCRNNLFFIYKFIKDFWEIILIQVMSHVTAMIDKWSKSVSCNFTLASFCNCSTTKSLYSISGDVSARVIRCSSGFILHLLRICRTLNICFRINNWTVQALTWKIIVIINYLGFFSHIYYFIIIPYGGWYSMMSYILIFIFKLLYVQDKVIKMIILLSDVSK